MNSRPLETIDIIGAGTMRAQIALHCAVHSYSVQVFSRSMETLRRASQSHSRELDRRLEEQKLGSDEKKHSGWHPVHDGFERSGF